jgi:TonB family protein
MTPARAPEAELSAAAKAPSARAPRKTPVTFLVASGCFVLLAVIAGLLFFYTNFGRASSASTLNLPVPAGTASQSTPVPASNAPVSTFQIEVVESNNKHWALNDPGSSGATSAAKTPPRDSGAKRSAADSKKAPANNRQWPLQPLRIPQHIAGGGNSATEPNLALPAPGLPAISSSSTPTGLLNSTSTMPRPPDPASSSPNPASNSALQSPVLIKRVEPRYPPQARPIRLEGAVQVSTTIGKDGVPRALKILSGNALFGSAAIDAISEWRFKPALLHGSPVEQPLIVTVTFRFKE